MTKFGLAQPVRRVEDPRLLMGGGRYTDDIRPAGAAVGVVLRSPHAAARVVAADATVARSVPGGMAVNTSAELKADETGGLPCPVPIENRDGSPRFDPAHPGLAEGMVRNAGGPEALVVGETARAARDGAEAAHVSRLTSVNHRIVVSSMEARMAAAEFEGGSGRFTLTTCTLGVWLLKEQLAKALFRMPEEKFRTMAGTKVPESAYGFQAIYAKFVGLFTNTIPGDACRGAGHRESNYPVEHLVDAAARELGPDRAEIRRGKMVASTATPYTTAMGQKCDSGSFRRALETALEKIDRAGFPASRPAAEGRARIRGIGLAYYLEATGGAPTERSELRFAADGFVDVFVGTRSTGQGDETAHVQLIADRLGVPDEKVRIHPGDSGAIATGGGTGGARSLSSEGWAILVSADGVIEKGRQAASEALEAAVADIAFVAGRVSIVRTDPTAEILDLAVRQRAQAAAGEAARIPDATEVADGDRHAFPNGCHVAAVEIDPDTGSVGGVRYPVCDDFGTIVNPLIGRGQVQGGVAQGIGQAILERTAYDSGSGQLLSDSFTDYARPRADSVAEIEVEPIEVPCLANPLAAKGAGEAGAVGSPPAVINALLDALCGCGVRHLDMPATPERVWRALAAPRAA